MQRSHASVVASVTHSDPPGELPTLNESPTIAPPEPSANIEKCVNPPAMTTEGPTLAVDELVVPAEAVERPTPGRERARPGRWLAVLAAGFVLQVAWRLYLYLPLVGPTAHADEDDAMREAAVAVNFPLAIGPLLASAPRFLRSRIVRRWQQHPVAVMTHFAAAGIRAKVKA